jgi:metal-dependent amidase/aminoacylase/carboxypeptidase family protein
MKDQITSLANNQCAAYGAKCNVVIESGLYRPVINNEGLVNRTNKILMQLEDC